MDEQSDKTGPGVTQGGKPRRRVLTAARKEQNRRAQQIFRSRQRERRRELLMAAPPSSACPVIRPSPHGVNEGPLAPGKSTSPGRGPARTAGLDNADSSLGAFNSPAPPVPLIQGIGDVLRNVDGTVDQAQCHHALGSLTPHHAAIYQRATLGPLSSTLSPDSLPSRSDGQSIPDDCEEIATSSTAISTTALSSSSEAFLEAWNSRVQSANLHQGGLQLMATNIFTAVLENALCLGFDLAELSSCRYDYVSPLYQPNITPQTDPATLLGSNGSALLPNTNIKMDDVPVHLRPTLAQILVPHHASLDLIPIPALREKAIMLSAAMPHQFNLLEFKIDIHKHGGLVVWRGESPSGNCKGAANGYQPWDMACWEAAPWFMEKWCMVVGGKDSEFTKQSSRWQAVREALGI